DFRLGRECRVATGEDQAESLVGHRLFLVVVALQLCEPLEQLGLPRQRLLAPNAVDRPVPRRRGQPGRRVLRHSVAWPALESGRDRVLEGVLGELEVAEDADQGGEDAAPLLAEEGFDAVQCSTTGLTSIAPP